jgi:hypothetical protein
MCRVATPAVRERLDAVARGVWVGAAGVGQIVEGHPLPMPLAEAACTLAPAASTC